MRTLVTLSSSTLACTPAFRYILCPISRWSCGLTDLSEGFEAEVLKFIRSCCSKKRPS
jgi:hypothetical protein